MLIALCEKAAAVRYSAAIVDFLGNVDRVPKVGDHDLVRNAPDKGEHLQHPEGPDHTYRDFNVRNSPAQRVSLNLEPAQKD